MASRDESFADDFDVRPGRVSSRVALLLRGAERKPVPARFVAGAASPRLRVRPLGSGSKGGEGEGGGGGKGSARVGWLEWEGQFSVEGGASRVGDGGIFFPFPLGFFYFFYFFPA